MWCLLSTMVLLLGTVSAQQGACYNAAGEAVRCMPDFVNIAYRAQVFASNTCGDPPSEYCVQQEIGQPNMDDENCYTCDSSTAEQRHPPSLLTDGNEDETQTWWQSHTLFDQNIENMTLHLPFNKSFDIEYIKIEFLSPRPESMIIEKSSDYGRTWEIYQYFSSSCYKTFNKRTDEEIYPWEETKAICTGKYSEISPLSGGVVAFSPLKGRPSAQETEKLFDTPLLLDWMRATDIRIRLIRLNTFGDQYFSNKRNEVLKTYYYAISDLSVGGRCTCHGHGAYCSSAACQCEHFTAGRNCERCMDMYNDNPWRESSVEDPFVCQKCDCNGLASRCVFEEATFELSDNTSGGVCVGCRANTAGQHCELCAHGYYPHPLLGVGHHDRCLPCQCNVYGSVGDGACAQQLDLARVLSFGDCQCKPHVKGIHCDTCEDGYHSLQEGCLRCDCDPVGTIGNHRVCDKANGQCRCRDNIAGRQCNECLPGYYGYLTGCRECGCDRAGSTSRSCHQQTGQCSCRKGYVGMFCSETQEGTYVPDMGQLVIRPDPLPEHIIDSGEEEEGPTTTSTATATPGMDLDNIVVDQGTLQDPDDEVRFTFTAPSDGPYTVVVQYTYPYPGQDAGVRFDVIADTPPGEVEGCEGQQVQDFQADLPPVSDGIHKLQDTCLAGDVLYVLRIALQDRVVGEVGILGIILVPAPTSAVIELLETLFEEGEEGQEAIDFCLDVIYEMSGAELEATYPECVSVSDIIVNDINNGSLSCECHPEGANSPDTCERLGGQCSCKPHVMGLKCDTCYPGYYEITSEGCLPCGCSGIGSRSSICHVETGECSCEEGVTGDKCEECEPGMYGFSPRGCSLCGCNPVGSSDVQCDEVFGQCICKRGVTGMQCDRCDDGYYDFSSSGCKQCECNGIGGAGGNSECDPDTGECRCKTNVQGERCLACKPNAFSLQQSNPEGCQACFCYGHAESCVADTSSTPSRVVSSFGGSDEGWLYKLGEERRRNSPEHYRVLENIRISNTGSTPSSYCLFAPEKFLGNQLGSFLSKLKFTFNVRPGSKNTVSELLSTVKKVVIRGNPLTLSLIPRVNPGDKYTVVLHPMSAPWLVSDSGSDSLSDQVTSPEFLSVLGDVKSLEICGIIHDLETLTLEEFSIGGVEQKRARDDRTAYNVELCDCPEGYRGSSCEACAAGYKRAEAGGGALSPCVPCECNGYSDTCDPDSGLCVGCSDNTGGDMCQVCEAGYYGTPGYGNPSSCKECQCPEAERSFSNTCDIQGGKMVCTNCTEGHIGDRCDMCDDGFFGEPSYANANQRCTQCICNGNIDLSVDGNCNTVTGQCLKCIGNSAGRECEECARGYFGDAIVEKNCNKCSCDASGSYNQYLCDDITGQCDCKPHVIGASCDRCEEGHFGHDLGEGCSPCQCDLLGSLDLQCEEDGVCLCREGYFGDKCNQCNANYYYNPYSGCTACDCDPSGSESAQCDEAGQCRCKGTVQGRRCDACPTNMVNISEGCVNCPDCYSLVSREVEQLREKLQQLKQIMSDMDTPLIEASPDFKNQIAEVEEAVTDTFKRASETAQLAADLNAAREDIEELIAGLQREMEDTELVVGQVTDTVASSENKIAQAQAAIRNIERQLEEGVRMLLEEGEAALQRAQDNMNTLSAENTEMQKKANAARRIAQEQEQKSGETVAMATEVSVLATEAVNTAKNARNTLRATQGQLDTLTADIGELKEEYELAKTAATNYISAAEDTLQSASQLREEACNAASDIDLEAVTTSLGLLDARARRAAEEADRLQERALEMEGTAAGALSGSGDLLVRGEEVDRGMEQLERAAQEALQQSKAAVQECTDLIADAQKLLHVLTNFEEEVESAKSEARDAILQMSSLEGELDTAESKVEGAVRKLGNGKRNMDNVLGSLVDAKGNLEASLDNAREVSARIALLREGSGVVAGDAQGLRDEVLAALSQIRALRNEAKNGTEHLKSVLREAENTQATANSIASTLDSGQRKLKTLGTQLQEIETLDADLLSELVRDLSSARQTLDQEGVADKIAAMRVISQGQEDRIAEYRQQIELMREEISTLESIEQSLPDDTECFNPNKV